MEKKCVFLLQYIAPDKALFFQPNSTHIFFLDFYENIYLCALAMPF